MRVMISGNAEMSKIVAIGAGEKGRALCELWKRIGKRDTSDDASEAQDAKILVFGNDVRDELPSLPGRLAAKVIIDCSNPTDPGGLTTGTLPVHALTRAYPDAGVVEAFNAVTPLALLTVANHQDPEIGCDSSSPDMSSLGAMLLAADHGFIGV